MFLLCEKFIRKLFPVVLLLKVALPSLPNKSNLHNTNQTLVTVSLFIKSFLYSKNILYRTIILQMLLIIFGESGSQQLFVRRQASSMKLMHQGINNYYAQDVEKTLLT